METCKHIESTGINRIRKIESRLIILYPLANNKDKTQSESKKKGIHSFFIGTKGKSAVSSSDRKTGGNQQEGVEKRVKIREDGLNTRRRPNSIKHDGRA
jgi:hypothetical protein